MDCAPESNARGFLPFRVCGLSRFLMYHKVEISNFELLNYEKEILFVVRKGSPVRRFDYRCLRLRTGHGTTKAYAALRNGGAGGNQGNRRMGRVYRAH